MVLVSYMNSQNQVNQGSNEFVGMNPSSYVTILSGLVAIGTVKSRYNGFILHVILRDQSLMRLYR